MISLAATIYAVFAGAAVLWCWLADRMPWPLYDPRLATWPRLGLGLALALAGGLIAVWLSRATTARFEWARQLERWFCETLGPLRNGQVLALAGLSSLGEELLFRGAMQPAWGIWPASAVFAVLHFPSRRVLWPWTLMAGMLGLGLGALTLICGSVAPSILAHFVINRLNLEHIARRARSTRAAGAKVAGTEASS